MSSRGKKKTTAKMIIFIKSRNKAEFVHFSRELPAKRFLELAKFCYLHSLPTYYQYLVEIAQELRRAATL